MKWQMDLLGGKDEEAGPKYSPLRRASDVLVEDYRQAMGCLYRHRGAQDTNALKGLLVYESLDEVRRRWQVGLERARQGRFPGAATFSELKLRWNHLAPYVRRSTLEESQGELTGEKVQL